MKRGQNYLNVKIFGAMDCLLRSWIKENQSCSLQVSI